MSSSVDHSIIAGLIGDERSGQEDVSIVGFNSTLQFIMAYGPMRRMLILDNYDLTSADTKGITERGFTMNNRTFNPYKTRFFITHMSSHQGPSTGTLVTTMVSEADLYLDKPALEFTRSGKLQECLESLYKPTKLIHPNPKVVIENGLAEKTLNISTPVNATRRDVLVALSKEHGFQWYLEPGTDDLIIGPKLDPSAREVPMKYFNINERMVTLNEGYGHPILDFKGRVLLGKEYYTPTLIKIIIMQGVRSYVHYVLRKENDDKYIGFDEAASWLQRNSPESIRMRSVDNPMPVLAEIEGLEVGGFRGIIKKKTTKIGTTDNVTRTVPWGNDTHYMSFPWKSGDTVIKTSSILLPTDQSTQFSIRDTIKLNDADAEDFVLKLPGDATLTWDKSDNTWTLEGANIKLGKDASDGVVRHKDLKAVVDVFNDHEHVVNVIDLVVAGSYPVSGTIPAVLFKANAGSSSKVKAE